MAAAVFCLRGIAPPEVKTTDMYRSITPFVIMQPLTIAILIIFPRIILWLPKKALMFWGVT